jgi:hypothetical protein
VVRGCVVLTFIKVMDINNLNIKRDDGHYTEEEQWLLKYRELVDC